MPVENSLRFATHFGTVKMPLTLYQFENRPKNKAFGSKNQDPEKFLPRTDELEQSLKETEFSDSIQA